MVHRSDIHLSCGMSAESHMLRSRTLAKLDRRFSARRETPQTRVIGGSETSALYVSQRLERIPLPCPRHLDETRSCPTLESWHYHYLACDLWIRRFEECSYRGIPWSGSETISNQTSRNELSSTIAAGRHVEHTSSSHDGP